MADVATRDEPAEDPATGGDEPFPTVAARVRDRWGALVERVGTEPALAVQAVITFAAVVLGTALVLATLHPSDLLKDTTTTGGDMGSHLWGPRYLIDHLLPQLRLSGWTPDWYSGFPAYQFYMVIPSLLVVAVHVGLPWWAAIPVLGALGAATYLAWDRRRWFRYRWAAVVLAGVAAVLVIPIPYNLAFKWVTVSGLVTLPLACWFLARAARLPFPIPPLASVAGTLFIFNREPLFNNTGNIIGGNFQSTMAGEFAFSVSLTLAVVYLGVAIAGLRTGRYRALAAVLFALAGLSHLIPAFFVLGCTVALLVVQPNRSRLTWLATMVPVAGLLTAFWVVPFAGRADYVNDMGWERLPLPNGEETSVWYYLLPDGLRVLFAMAVVGLVVSAIRRWSLGLVLGLAWAGVWIGFSLLPQARLWNARLLPFMYLSVALLAAIGVGEVIRVLAAAASGDARRPLPWVTGVLGTLAVLGTLIYVALPINGILPGLITRAQVAGDDGEVRTESSLRIADRPLFSTTAVNPSSGWSANNYSGLEEKQPQPAGCAEPGSEVACTSGGWEEFKDVVATMQGIGDDERYGCGRAFWEYDFDRIGGYGTPMALMMLPYFTDSCIGSQEGLYFESSTTVPYHFLMQAELSTQPSQPQRDLPYPTFDIDAGVRHLQLMGVDYYLATSTNAVDQASRHRDLTEIAVTGPWHVYQVAEAPLVQPLAYEPVVLEGIDESQDGWLPTASAWFRSAAELDRPLAAHGPDDWARVEAEPVDEPWRLAVSYLRNQLGEGGPIDQVPDAPRTELPEIEVSDIQSGDDSISFTVSEPGVPVLVKTSYFPNWEASGAEGPYRVTPNLMVVVPTDTEVSLHYGRTPLDLLALAMTLLGIVGVVFLARRPPLAMAPTSQSRVGEALDRWITITPPAAPEDPFPPGEPLWTTDEGEAVDDPLRDPAAAPPEEVAPEPSAAIGTDEADPPADGDP